MMAAPDVRVFADMEAAGRAAAEHFRSLAAAAVSARGQFSVALSGGGTPQRLFQLLAERPYSDDLPWSRMHFFWGDERSVPPDDPGSNYAQANRMLLSRVAAPAANIHRIRGELGSVAAAEDYAEQLSEYAAAGFDWPRFDLALMGMGTDGHTASLFPGPITEAERQAPTMAVTAQYEDRPSERVTLTPLVFNAARTVMFMAGGVAKAETLAMVLHGPHDPERWPAQRIRPTDGELVWMVDEAAAAKLNFHREDAKGAKFADAKGSGETKL